MFGIINEESGDTLEASTAGQSCSSHGFQVEGNLLCFFHNYFMASFRKEGKELGLKIYPCLFQKLLRNFSLSEILPDILNDFFPRILSNIL